jgi:hypothetical protein
VSFMDRLKETNGKAAEERSFRERVAERLGINWRVNDMEHAPQSAPPEDPQKPGPKQVLSAREFVRLYHGPVDRANVPRSMLRRPRYSLTD